MRVFGKTWSTDIALVAQAKLDKNKERACECSIIFNSEHGFEVGEENYRHIIDLYN